MQKSLRNKANQFIGIHLAKGNSVAFVLRDLMNYCDRLEKKNEKLEKRIRNN